MKKDELPDQILDRIFDNFPSRDLHYTGSIVFYARINI